jgi:hypothetical protein
LQTNGIVARRRLGDVDPFDRQHGALAQRGGVELRLVLDAQRLELAFERLGFVCGNAAVEAAVAAILREVRDVRRGIDGSGLVHEAAVRGDALGRCDSLGVGRAQEYEAVAGRGGLLAGEKAPR